MSRDEEFADIVRPQKHAGEIGNVEWCDEAAVAREIKKHKPPSERERE